MARQGQVAAFANNNGRGKSWMHVGNRVTDSLGICSLLTDNHN
jgi:hypothetical protein